MKINHFAEEFADKKSFCSTILILNKMDFNRQIISFKMN